MPPEEADADIRAFIAASSATTYTELARAIFDTFGPDRAWTTKRISAVRRELRPRLPGGRSPYMADGQVMAFIRDRADLVSLDSIVAAGVAELGAGRFPGRTVLGRIVKRIRSEP